MRHLLESSGGELQAWIAERGHPKYRADQIRRWIFRQRVDDFTQMSDLPLNLREQLDDEFCVWRDRIAKHSTADDGTEKLLVELGKDGERIESVLLRDDRRRSICISTQVGCAMGCVFCASGLDGVKRNLTTAEIVEQMLRLQNLLPEDERLSHIVVMGMGEPLANLDNLLPALQLASSNDGLGISPRRITISTVGLPKSIDRLIEIGAKYHLAVSLHAPDDRLRNQLVPINRKTGVELILAASDRYFAASGRRLTYEYVLLEGVNDQPRHARQLVELLADRTALLNVIPYNPVAGLPYRTPSPDSIRAFRQILQMGGMTVKFRKRKGSRIDAACGQLRRSAALE